MGTVRVQCLHLCKRSDWTCSSGPEVAPFTESPADNTEPPVLSVNPEASAGEFQC